MTDSDQTVSILRDIRDGILVLAERLDGVQAEQKAMRAEQTATNAKLDVMNEHVDAIGRYAKNVSRRHEKAIDELRERVAKLEARRKN